MTDVITRLNEISTVIEEDDTHRVPELYEELLELYKSRRPDLRLKRERVKSGLNSELELNNNEEVISYFEDSVRRDQMEAGIVGALSITSFTLTDIDFRELNSRIKDLISVESSLDGRFEDIEDILNHVETEGSIQILNINSPSGPIPKGSIANLEIISGNPGDNEISGEVILETSGVIDSKHNKTILIDSFSIEESNFDLNAVNKGDVNVMVKGISSDVDDVSKTELRILDKSSLIVQAVRQIENLKKNILGNVVSNSYLSKLDSSQDRLNRAKKFADKGQSKKANNQLNSAINTLSAINNQIDGLQNNRGKNQPNQSKSIRIKGSTDRIISVVESAKNADI